MKSDGAVSSALETKNQRRNDFECHRFNPLCLVGISTKQISGQFASPVRVNSCDCGFEKRKVGDTMTLTVWRKDGDSHREFDVTVVLKDVIEVY